MWIPEDPAGADLQARAGVGEVQEPVDGWIVRPRPRPEARLQLVCFAHAGGGALGFGGWVRKLREDVELLAIQLPGRENRHREPPISDPDVVLDGIVAALGAALRKPYAVFGHSLGARLGHLTACRLRETASGPPVRLFLSAAAPSKAPPDPSTEPLDDETLLNRLERYGGTPPGLLGTPEGRSLFLPAIRADFALAGRLPWTDVRLDAPFVLLGGEADRSVSLAEIVAWRGHSSRPCPAHLFPGGHFYAQADPGPLIDLINATLEADIAVA